MTLQNSVGIATLNETRHNFFRVSHSWDKENEDTTPKHFINWLGHKALTIISLPINVANAGVSGLAGIVSGCTLGAIKVSVFAVTLGNIKPSFPTVFFWFLESSLHSVVHIGINTAEVFYDAGNIFYLGYKLIRWAGDKLHLGNFLEKIFQSISDALTYVEPIFKFLYGRISKGFDKALSHENSNFKLPDLLCSLNNRAKETRLDWSAEDRSFESIVDHGFYSIGNIPLNSIAAIASTFASIPTTLIFSIKVALYAITNIEISLPTYAPYLLNGVKETSYNAAADVSTIVGDSFILLYKGSEALGLNKVIVKAKNVLHYIPEAVFS